MKTTTENPLYVVLSSVGNPDHGEKSGYIQRPVKVACRDISEASQICREFCSQVGSGNWSGGQVFRGKEQVARISYNGRAWKTGNVREEIFF